jgi:hypothetical protein
MTKVYTTKANATRAAKTQASKAFAGLTFTVDSVEGGFVVKQHSPLSTMDQFGAGTVDAPKCPHCGINHIDNGTLEAGDEDGNGDNMVFETGSFVCLACNGEWGPAPTTFAVKFEAVKAAGNSDCKALRVVAYAYNGKRTPFINDAVAHGINKHTASTQWACMKRGEV